MITISDSLAAAALIISLISGYFAFSSAKQSVRSADAAEKSLYIYKDSNLHSERIKLCSGILTKVDTCGVALGKFVSVTDVDPLKFDKITSDVDYNNVRLALFDLNHHLDIWQVIMPVSMEGIELKIRNYIIYLQKGNFLHLRNAFQAN